MVLQFQPPPYRDPDKEIGDAWGQALGSGLSSIGQSAQQMQQYKRDQALKDLQMRILQQEEARKQSEEARKQTESAAEYGSPAPSTMTTPITGPMTQGQSIRTMLDPGSPASPTPAAGGMVEKFRQWQQSRRSGPAAQPAGIPGPEVGHNEVLPGLFDPATERGLGWSGMTSPGTKGVEAAGKLFEAKKKLEGGDFYTPEQTLSLVPGEAGQRLIKAYPGGKVPKDAVHVAASGSRFDVTHGEKEDQFTKRRLTLLGDALDPTKAKGGSFGSSKQVFDRAERLETLANAFSDGNLDSRQVEELAIGLNSMLSGSNSGAQEQVKQLVPKTIFGNAQKTLEWLTNEPRGTQQQAFVQRMLGSIAREKQTAADQIKRVQFQRVGRYGDLETSSPDAFYNELEHAGLDPEEYKTWKKNGFKPMSAVQKPEDGTGAPVGPSNQSFSAIRRNPRTGEKVGWNGSAWVKF